ncbi:hypothetical protein [Thermophilibacter mediterraneus]|uniref:hypothetical protein n=1 Tax=Thermophilibacter mediterraneus TaxID=1871031 RepID=UPI00320A2CC9
MAGKRDELAQGGDERDGQSPVEQGPADGEKDVRDEKGGAADDALAADAEGSDGPDGAPAPRRTLSTPVWVAVCVIALVAGVALGHFGLGGASTIALEGKTSLSSNELDSTIATYTFDGVTTNVTAREVITSGGSELDTALNDDGSYSVPAAANVLVYAQNEIILQDAERRGITASDDELSSYAEQTLGSSDIASIAESYGMDEESVRAMLEQRVLVEKLRDAVCETELPDQPSAPTEPEEGAEDTPTAEYASYIIALLGDEWDSETGTWARTDGSYYATLSSYEITADSATYAAAEAAYNIASSLYSEAYSQVSDEWQTYTRNLLSGATIQIGSLVAS